MALQADGFNRSVALPPELKITHIREAIEHVENRATELIDIYLEQANVFSGIVGIFGVQALHALSPYKSTNIPTLHSNASLIFHCEETGSTSATGSRKQRIYASMGFTVPTTITPAGT
jgi:hypothetical protein